MSEESPLDRPPAPCGKNGPPLIDDADRSKPGAISTGDLLYPIYLRTFYAGVIAPFLFAFLGSSNVLAPYVQQSQWLVSKMAPINPALPPQFELVLEIRGPGHAASFGFFCAALWIWPIICAAAVLWEHAKRREEIRAISLKEVGQFFLFLPFSFFFLVVDTTPSDTFPLSRFRADQWGFFYLRSWFLFSLAALVLAMLIYAIGRIVLDWTWRRAT